LPAAPFLSRRGYVSNEDCFPALRGQRGTESTRPDQVDAVHGHHVGAVTPRQDAARGPSHALCGNAALRFGRGAGVRGRSIGPRLRSCIR